MCSTYRPMIFVDFQPPARMIGTRPTNARFSSGPKSVAGKTRSARNAFRHGFNVPVALVPDLAGDVEALARRLCGEGSDPSLMELARRVAEAQIDLRRVRAYRQRLIQRALTDQGFQNQVDQAGAIQGGGGDPSRSLQRFARRRRTGDASAAGQGPREAGAHRGGLRKATRGARSL